MTINNFFWRNDFFELILFSQAKKIFMNRNSLHPKGLSLSYSHKDYFQLVKRFTGLKKRVSLFCFSD